MLNIKQYIIKVNHVFYTWHLGFSKLQFNLMANFRNFIEWLLNVHSRKVAHTLLICF